MKFNRFVWQLYVKSEQGRMAVNHYARLTSSYLGCDDLYRIGEDGYSISTILKSIVEGEKFRNQKAASDYYRNPLVKRGILIPDEHKRGKKKTFSTFPNDNSDWYDYIAAISLGLYKGQPEYFLPYNFRCKFNQLEEIHAAFGIPLTPAPGKGDQSGRTLYYAEINEAWQGFRHLYGLKPAEMCAFLYDFAPKFISPMDSTDLPTPSKVWLITGGSWDIKTADKATPKTVIQWGGNHAIRRGDILMLYLVNPHKAIHSIWRACTDGFVDPFFHYHGTVWICGQIKTAPVNFSELSGHPLLSRKPAVRAHFQGASSKASFSVEEYEVILKIMKSKGQDISLLPRIALSDYLPKIELKDEGDVEAHLIEPFLRRLGYNKSDWVRQMPVRMGRGERNYPDYLIGANTKRGEESAQMVFEAKFQLSGRREFMEAFYQTKSYALRLRCKIMAMAAREGIWVFSPVNGDFDIKNFKRKGWGELNSPDAFHELLRLISRDAILG